MNWWVQSGKVWPLNVPVGQSWVELGAQFTAIQEFKVRTYIEIGMDQGGMAPYLLARQAHDKGFRYFGIEIDTRKLALSVVEMLDGTNFRDDDCFSEASIKKVRQMIDGSDGTAMVYCDGGNKAGEMQVFSQYLHQGDIILAHDYPTEITDGDFPPGLERVVRPWLEETRFILGQKLAT